MDKLKTTNNGGMPLELDDIRWEQQAVRDAFKGILLGFKPANASGFILQGCAVTDNTTYFSITTGYVYINGEIFYVPAHDCDKSPDPTAHYVFDIEETYDAAGEEVFEDGTVQNTYLKRRAKVYDNDDPSFNENLWVQMSSSSLFDIIKTSTKSYIESFVTAWVEIDSVGAPPFQNGFTNASYENVAFMKDAFNTVYLRGVAHNSDPTLAIAFVLPTGYRPSQKMTHISDISGTVCQIIINTNGEVQISGGSGVFNFLTYKTT